MNTRIHETTVLPPADFTTRQRRPTPPQLALTFAAVFVVVLLMVIGSTEKFLSALILVAIFGGLGWYITMQFQLMRDLLLEAEFQNSLFASALAINHKFLAIVRNDQTITYFNRGFQETFPKFLRQPRRTIDVLLDQCEVKPDERDKVMNAIRSGAPQKIVFELYHEITGPQKIILTAEAIDKPSGFVLLRGREFIDPRKQQVQTTKVLE